MKFRLPYLAPEIQMICKSMLQVILAWIAAAILLALLFHNILWFAGIGMAALFIASFLTRSEK